MYPFVWFNNNIQRQNETTLSIHDRSSQFGDGVYEVIRLYIKKGEPTYHLLDEHLNRLFRSLEEMKIPSPFTREEVVRQLYKLAQVNNVEADAYVYLQISRGLQLRNHTYEEDIVPVVHGYLIAKPRPLTEMAEGVTVLLQEDIRWLRCDIKSLNLLPNIMAKQEAKRKGCFEAILHRNGVITEGSASNVFIVKDNILYTHPSTNLILNGIVRQDVLRLADELQIPIQEKAYTCSDLQNADEVFITSTTLEIVPVRSIQGVKDYPQERKVTKVLQEAFYNEF